MHLLRRPRTHGWRSAALIEIPIKTPITLFVRIRGDRGERELKAILDTFSTCMTIPFEDAVQLGYDPDFDPLIPDKATGRRALSIISPLEVCTVTLREVVLGELRAENVEAVVYNFPSELGVDVLLGISFLKNFKTTLDYGRNILKIEKIEP